MALKFIPNVKVLGKKTMGAATMNSTIKLKNGDMLNLTAGYMLDAKENIYPNGISPDCELCTEDDILNFIKSDIKNSLLSQFPNKIHYNFITQIYSGLVIFVEFKKL
ncbi:S41 family peptidase [Empedobacter stercoris]|uniref:Tail specific protease domain-containing protein n=1 Tax=Empedobacter stercoris TaxID=1628248 RepID=A0ABX1WJJ2_9FLAO|nr:S41 family peptidase [Empedobacter stercoris]NOJ74814.1 hypothetical protein [Empedobacter stercoris]